MTERIETRAVLETMRLTIAGMEARDETLGIEERVDLAEWRDALAQEIADREALEMERDEWEAAVRYLHGHYPEDVFPPNSNTPDAKAGTFARRLLGWLLDPVERTRLAALRGEEGK